MKCIRWFTSRSGYFFFATWPLFCQLQSVKLFDKRHLLAVVSKKTKWNPVEGQPFILCGATFSLLHRPGDFYHGSRRSHLSLVLYCHIWLKNKRIITENGGSHFPDLVVHFPNLPLAQIRSVVGGYSGDFVPALMHPIVNGIMRLLNLYWKHKQKHLNRETALRLS